MFRVPLSASTLAFAALVAVLSSCATRAPPEESPAAFRPVDWKEVGDLTDDGDLASTREALDASLAWARAQPDTRELSFGPAKVPLTRVRESLEALSTAASSSSDQAGFLARIKETLVPWKAQARGGKPLLVTGYYVPVLEGSFERTEDFALPVYGVPGDLVSVALGDFSDDLKGKTVRGRVEGAKLVPYFDRKQIRGEAALDGRAPVVAWARSEWDAFVMEVQGSGILSLPDGSRRLLGYAEQNGRGYKAVGKLLLDEKRIPKERMSMQAIGRYLADHPGEVRRVLDSNPSFVFFDVSEGRAKGSLGFPLTGGRSVAVDMRNFPAGGVGFLRSHVPHRDEAGRVVSKGTLARLVFNQDTGGAIRGLGRADFFWGEGPEAFEKAGAMQHEGEYFLLLPKGFALAPAQGGKTASR